MVLIFKSGDRQRACLCAHHPIFGLNGPDGGTSFCSWLLDLVAWTGTLPIPPTGIKSGLMIFSHQGFHIVNVG